MIVIYYRKFNDISVGKTYPIPQITEILDQLDHSKYISTLDLTFGFHHILISQDDTDQVAFSVPSGQFQFNRMPFFGLKKVKLGLQLFLRTTIIL